MRERSPYTVFYRVGRARSPPDVAVGTPPAAIPGGSSLVEEGVFMEATVSEIHRQPLRPPGYAEPLFLGRAAKKEIADYLRESSGWLGKASDVERSAGKPCHVLRRPGGAAYLVRSGTSRPARRPNFAKRRVARVLERWREVERWWSPGGADRLLFRVLLEGPGEAGEAGGVVVDLALDRSGPRAGSWSLVRVLD